MLAEREHLQKSAEGPAGGRPEDRSYFCHQGPRDSLVPSSITASIELQEPGEDGHWREAAGRASLLFFVTSLTVKPIREVKTSGWSSPPGCGMGGRSGGWVKMGGKYKQGDRGFLRWKGWGGLSTKRKQSYQRQEDTGLPEEMIGGQGGQVATKPRTEP